MILKFLQGGLQNQQMEQLFAALDQQPQEAVQELIKKGVEPEQIMQLTQVGVQQKKIKPESAQVIQNTLLKLVKAAKHGAKLNYIKLLNHKCADDEELYYFKKGGRVGCGCKKKMEDGGQLKDKSWKAEFKAKQAKKRATKANNVVGKNCGGAKIKFHKLGGSLNGIPFMQAGGEINPYDARYSLAERLKASTEQGNNKFYNLYDKIKRLLNKYPTPISTIPGNEKAIDYINRYPSPIALLPNGREFVMNGQTPLSAAIYLGGKILNSSKLPERKPIHNEGAPRYRSDSKGRTSQQTKITPANALLTEVLLPNGFVPKQEKPKVTKNESQTKPEVIKGSQTNFGGVQRGWRNIGQFESVIDSLTPQLLMWLDLQGISTENALTLQKGINKYLKSIGDNRSIAEDNHWGNQSLSALNEILQNVPSNVSLLNIPKENSIELYPTRREGLEAGFFKKGGNLNGIPFYQAGTKVLNNYNYYKSKELVESENNQNRNNAKGLFRGIISGEVTPTMLNLGRMISSAYKGWISPKSAALTGIAPTPGLVRNPRSILRTIASDDPDVSLVTNIARVNKNKIVSRILGRNNFNKTYARARIDTSPNFTPDPDVDVRLASVPYNQVPAGERITFFKNANGTRTPRYYDKKLGYWIDVEMLTPRTTSNIAKVTKAKPYYDDDVMVIPDSDVGMVPEYNYNDNFYDNSMDYLWDPGMFDSFKKGGLILFYQAGTNKGGIKNKAY